MFRYSSPKPRKHFFRALSHINNNLILSNSNYNYRTVDYENSNYKNKNDDYGKYLRISSISNNKKYNHKLRNSLVMQNKIKESLLKNSTLKYIPKNKILKNNINFFNKTSINNLMKKEESEKINKTDIKIILNDENKRDIKAEINQHSETDIIKYRTEYILKYSQFSDYFNHLLTINKDVINSERRNNFNGILLNENKIYENLNRLILEKIQCDFPLEYSTWKTLINSFYEFTFEFKNIVNFLFEELKIIQNKNLELNQKLFEKENILNSKTIELNKCNDLIEKYDLNSKKKIKDNKKKEFDINSVKLKSIEKENIYVLTIYKLEEEIKSLNELLERKKIKENELTSIKNLNNEKDKKIDKIRNILNQEINDMHAKISFLKDEIDELKNDKRNLKKENTDLKEEIYNKNFQLLNLEKDKKELMLNLKQKETKINSLQDTICLFENKDNLNDNDNYFLNNPILSVMTSSHKV